MPQELPPRQKSILEYLRVFLQQQGCPPSYREIGQAFGIRSTNGVSAHLQALEKKGYIERMGSGGLARSIRLTEKARFLLQPEGAPRPSMTLPRLGRVIAGRPVSPAAEEDGTLVVDASLCPRGGPSFVLQVQGDSMVEDGIFEGDMLIVKEQAEAQEMDIVVALLDGETTVKRFHRAPAGVMLVPANRAMKPIPVRAESQFSIAGVVVGLVRKI
jgi:repressor LexA